MRGLIKALRTAGLLIRHDLRVSFRETFSRFRRSSLAGFVIMEIGGLIILHLFASPIARKLASAQASGNTFLMYTTAASSIILFLPWLISMTTSNAVKTIYSRGDLDLILSSPVQPRAIFGSRCVAIATESLLLLAPLVVPIADMSAWRAGARWFSITPTFVLCSFLATALGLVIAFLLFRVSGPRRARFMVQITGSVISLSFIAYSQFINLLPYYSRSRLFGWLNPRNGGVFDQHAWYWLPIRAASGNSWDLMIWAAVCLTAFVGAIVLLGPAFISFAARATGTPIKKPNPWALARPLRFKSGAGRLVRINEGRFLRRHISFIPIIVKRVAYVLPFSGAGLFLASGPPHSAAGTIVCCMLVVIACRLAGAFARMTLPDDGGAVSDLILTAPVDRGEVELQKLRAIALPLIVLLAPPICLLAILYPIPASYALIFILFAVISSAVFNLWRQISVLRSGAKARQAEFNFISRRESLLSFCWAGALALALSNNILALAPVALALGMLYANRPSRLRRRRSGDQKPFGRAPAPC